MEKDYSDHLKYSIRFECAYIVPNEEGVTEATAKEKAIKRFSSVVQKMAKQIEEERKKTPTPKVILEIEKEIEERKSFEEKELEKIRKNKPNIKPTLKNQLSLLNITVEKLPTNNNYLVLFQYEFTITTKIADEGLVQAIALKEAPFSAGFLSVLHMKIKRVYE